MPSITLEGQTFIHSDERNSSYLFHRYLLYFAKEIALWVQVVILSLVWALCAHQHFCSVISATLGDCQIAHWKTPQPEPWSAIPHAPFFPSEGFSWKPATCPKTSYLSRCVPTTHPALPPPSPITPFHLDHGHFFLFPKTSAFCSLRVRLKKTNRAWAFSPFPPRGEEG